LGYLANSNIFDANYVDRSLANLGRTRDAICVKQNNICLFYYSVHTYKEKNQMANITISNLRPAGADLFDSSESYLQELSDMELVDTNGGITPAAVVGAFALGLALGVAISTHVN
jgi:lactobin A/cerein 7B family class IIb bacteriocin